MGTVCIIFVVLITVFVLMLTDFNDTALNIAIMYTDKAYEISLLVLSLMIYALGIISGALLVFAAYFDIAKRYRSLKNEYEKTDINLDDKDEKVKLLENKIQTLEAALKSAMEK